MKSLILVSEICEMHTFGSLSDMEAAWVLV